MPSFWQLVFLLYPALLLLAASTTEEDVIAEIGKAGKTGRSIREVINGEEMETLIRKQWWSAALAAIKLDHEQQSQQGRVDFYGPSVRKATREIKARADELVRSLDQNYFKPQKVAPAFQWAQNDTAIFINVKFTRRWNAPGALDIRNPEVNISDNDIHVTAVGEHSGKKHEYTLHLSFFDHVDPSVSRWAMASVGKLSATLVKANRRSKWPRLLASKDRKVTNMHYWMDFAEIHEESLAGLPTPKFSLATCRLQKKKAYCVGDDKCVDSCADDCSGKLFTGPDGRCHGKPQEEVSQINFTDSDPKKGFISGTIEVNSTATFGDAEFFAVYFLDENNTKLSEHPILKIINPKMRATRLLETLPEGVRIPEEASKITAVPSNEAFGESDSVGFATVSIEDWAVPEYPPQGLELEDTSPEIDELGGVIKILPAHSEDSQPSVDFYTLYWGKSATSCERLPDSRIGRTRSKGPLEATFDLGKSMAIKKGAESIVAFSMHNDEDGAHPSKGEMMTPCAIWPIQDRSRPSASPRGVSIIDGGLDGNTGRFTGVVVIYRSDREQERKAHVDGYSLWWCDNDRKKLNLMDTREVNDKDISELRLPFKEVEVPEGASKICGFMKNSLGEGKEGPCISINNAKGGGEEVRDDL